MTCFGFDFCHASKLREAPRISELLGPELGPESLQFPDAASIFALANKGVSSVLPILFDMYFPFYLTWGREPWPCRMIIDEAFCYSQIVSKVAQVFKTLFCQKMRCAYSECIVHLLEEDFRRLVFEICWDRDTEWILQKLNRDLIPELFLLLSSRGSAEKE